MIAADGLAHRRPRAATRHEALAHRPGAGRRRDPRAAPGGRRVRRPRARGRRRAAPVRRRAARRARGQGDPRRAPRPADDRDADPADAGPGALRGPRRVDAAVRARRPHPDPDRDPPARTTSRARGTRSARRRRPAGARSSSCRGSGRRRPRRPRRGRRRAAGGWLGDDELPDEDVETAWAAAAEAEAVRLARRSSRRSGSGSSTGGSSRRTATARWPASATATWTCSSARPWSRSASTCTQATMMVVEGAERFGLAQLHQLRGRVGRGTDPVVLRPRVSMAAEGTTEHERLKAVAATTDGFELAERDFELRREGDVLGLAQSGLPRLRVATLANAEHRELAATARASGRSGCSTTDGRLRPTPGARPRARRRLAAARVSPATRRARRSDGRRGPGHRGHRARRPARRAGTGHPAARRPGQADAVRDPRAGARGRARSLDLFAGSGAGGDRGAVAGRRERGARREGRRRVPGRSRRTCGAPRLEDRARVVRRDVIAWLADAAGAGAAGPFDLVLVDPPYADTAALVRALGAGRAAPSPRTASSSRSTSGATRRRRGVGMLAVRARAAVRRDGAHVLPAAMAGDGTRRRTRREDRGLSRARSTRSPNGHLDVVRRAARVFDRVVVAVLGNPRKSPLLDADDARRGHPRGHRRRIRRSPASSRSATFDGLTVDVLPPRSAPGSSSAACGRSRTSSRSSSSPTTTTSSRPTSTPCSS